MFPLINASRRHRDLAAPVTWEVNLSDITPFAGQVQLKLREGSRGPLKKIPSDSSSGIYKPLSQW